MICPLFFTDTTKAAIAVIHDPVALAGFGARSGIPRPNEDEFSACHRQRKVLLVGCNLAVQFRLHLGAQKNLHYVL